MNSTVDFFKCEKHYEEICRWWESQNWPVIPVTHLPQIGFVVSVDEIPSAAGWVYQTDSAFCLFEWIVANPLVRREKRTLALSTLFEKAKEAAKEMGFKTIFISARHRTLIERLKNHGFTEGENNMTNLTFSIQGGS